MDKKWFGYFLIILGFMLSLYKLEIVPLKAFISWYFILSLIGTLFIISSFIQKNPTLVLIGGTIFAIGLSIWGNKYIALWPKNLSPFLILLGITFLLQYALNKQYFTAFIGSMFILTGISYLPGIKNIPFVFSLTRVFQTYWPFVLIITGVFILTNKKKVN